MSLGKKEKRKAGRPKKNKDLNTNTILRIALKRFAPKGLWWCNHQSNS